MVLTRENITFVENVRSDDRISSTVVNDMLEKGKSGRPTVSVIIPTLNEEKNIPLVLPFLPLDWIDEVILVDGRSTDKTVEIAKQLLPSIKIVLEPRRGKGIAMRSGYQAAKGDILVVLDADGSNDPREIPRYIMSLTEGADFAKGSRFAVGGGTTDMPRVRQLGNASFVLLCNLLFNLKMTDLCYGYHAFWRHCLDDLDLRQFDGFEIDTALYLQAVRNKLRLVEVPSFEGYRFYGVGKLQTIPDGIRVLKTIIREWFASLTGHGKEMYLGFRGIRMLSQSETVGSDPEIRLHSSQFNLQFLRLLSMKLLAGSDMHYALRRVLQFTLDTVGATNGSLILLDENGNVRDEASLILGNESQLSKPASWPDVLQQGLAGWVVKNRQPALVIDTNNDPRWLRRTWDGYEPHGRSALSIPLISDDRVIGVLTLTRPQAKTFTNVELHLLLSFALSI
jgi:glycosyltransferase involved in cell wall biosynthesis